MCGENLRSTENVLIGAHFPSQDEVDAVAHFVEAVGEMRASPLLRKKYQALTLRSSEIPGFPARVSTDLPDQQTVAAVIVPFRRIWQVSEQCH